MTISNEQLVGNSREEELIFLFNRKRSPIRTRHGEGKPMISKQDIKTPTNCEREYIKINDMR